MANFKPLGNRELLGTNASAVLKLDSFTKNIGKGLDRYAQQTSMSGVILTANNNKLKISLRYAETDSDGNLTEIENEVLYDATVAHIDTSIDDLKTNLVAFFTGKTNEYGGTPETALYVLRYRPTGAPNDIFIIKVEGTKNSSDNKVLVYATAYK